MVWNLLDNYKWAGGIAYNSMSHLSFYLQAISAIENCIAAVLIS